MRTLIVDDEPRALESLRHLCEEDANIDEVAVAECGAAAIEMICESRPDLLLLDAELSDMTGFDVLRSLNRAEQPAFIMVAAHEEHAVQAFRSGVVDYLTKPIGASQFATAMERVQERREFTQSSSQETVAEAGAALDARARVQGSFRCVWWRRIRSAFISSQLRRSITSNHAATT